MAGRRLYRIRCIIHPRGGSALRTVGEQAAPALPGAMLPQAHHAVRENGIDGVGRGLCGGVQSGRLRQAARDTEAAARLGPPGRSVPQAR